MIKASHNWIGVRFFSMYSRLRLHRNFIDIKFAGEYSDNGKSLLVVANHFSWWDGFIQNYLNDRFIHKKYHVVMLDEQLRRNMILTKAGAFSIDRSSRSFMESLRYCIELLDDPDNLVLIFPQGKIESMHKRRSVFERGLEYIIKKTESKADVMFNVNLVDYFSRSKPSLGVYFKLYQPVLPIDIKRIEDDYNEYTLMCIEKQGEL